MDWRNGLKGQAYDFVMSNNYPERVIAGPGTGKTWSLKRKIARLLTEGVNPRRILIVTFTRMATQDILQDIRKMHVRGVDEIEIRTLHSLCFSILTQSRVFNSVNRSPRPLLQFEERFLLEDLSICDPEFKEKFHQRSKRLQAFNAAWAREQDQIPGWPSEAIDRDFHLRLKDWLNFHDSMLIGELITLVIEYLRRNPQAPEFGKYDFVFVDEYQDLNKSEQSLIDLISEGANLVIIGDEDQSIYEFFRYAHPTGIMEFELSHNGCESFTFEDCHRCPE